MLWSLAEEGHALNHFNVGNLETLSTAPERAGRDPRAELVAWWSENYCAKRTKVVVAGREDLDTLQGWVETLFAGARLVTDHLPPGGVYRTYSNPYGPGQAGQIVCLKPLSQRRRLKIQLPVPDVRHLHHTKVRETMDPT